MIIKMRCFTKYIVVVSLLLCPFISAFGQKTVSLRVMSMNIRQGGEYAGNKSEPYSELINKYDPDVVALQEVDYKTTRNGKRDWLNEVAMQTGMFPYFCKSITYQGGAFGTAILSKYPFFKCEKTVFSHKDTREDRATGWIYVQLPCGATIRVGVVHLSLETSQLTKQHFASINKAFFVEDTTTPALMIGDYNASNGSDAINYVKNKWQDVIPDLGFTIPATGPTTQLDYVMGYPKGKWTCTKHEVLPRADMSDHCFIVADVQITLE